MLDGSAQARLEREHCCDLVVVTRIGGAGAYAETLFAVAGDGRIPVPWARIRRNFDVQEHPMNPMQMKLSRRVAASAAAIVLGPILIMGAMAQQSARQDSREKGAASRTPSDKEKSKVASGTAPGPSIRDLVRAIKDPDPAVRRKAATALSESDPEDEEFQAVRSALCDARDHDKDSTVRHAAWGASLFERAMNRQQLEANRKRAQRAGQTKAEATGDLEPITMTITLVDTQGGPVADADVGTFLLQNEGEKPRWYILDRPSLGRSRVRSGADGRAVFRPDVSAYGRSEVAFYALQQTAGLVGLLRSPRADLRKPLKLTMFPACRVRTALGETELRALAEKFHTPPDRIESWKAAYVNLGEYGKAPSPLWTGTKGRHLEFLLPPGTYHLMVYGGNSGNVLRDVEVKSGRRELFLGTIELTPSFQAQQGQFALREESRILQGRLILLGETRSTRDIALSADGKQLATGHSYNANPSEVKLWDLGTGEQIAELECSRAALHAVAFSRDGKTLAAAHEDGAILLWDVASRNRRATLKVHDQGILTIDFSPDGTMLASGGLGREVRIAEWASGRQVGSIAGFPGTVRAVRFSPDGKLLAIAAGESVTLWTAGDWKRQSTLTATGFLPRALAFSPDGTTLAAAGGETKPAVWKQADGQEVKGWTGVRGLTRLWDVATRRERDPLTHEEQDLRQNPPNRHFDSSVAFSPDGKTLAVVNMRELYFWDIETGKLRESTTSIIGSGADMVVFSRDGKLLARLNAGRVDISVIVIH